MEGRGNQHAHFSYHGATYGLQSTDGVFEHATYRSRQKGAKTLRQDSSALRSELSLGHFGTSADLSGQFGPTKLVPKCPGSEVSWVQSVRYSFRSPPLPPTILQSISYEPQTAVTTVRIFCRRSSTVCFCKNKLSKLIVCHDYKMLALSS